MSTSRDLCTSINAQWAKGDLMMVTIFAVAVYREANKGFCQAIGKEVSRAVANQAHQAHYRIRAQQNLEVFHNMLFILALSSCQK